MGIVVNWGNDATLDLGRESGRAQGEAEKSLREQQQLSQYVLTGFHTGALAAQKAIDDINRTTGEQEKQQFQSDQLDKQLNFKANNADASFQNKLDVQGLRNDGSANRAGITADASRYRTDASTGVADRRLFEMQTHHGITEDQGQQRLDALPTPEENAAKQANRAAATAATAERTRLMGLENERKAADAERKAKAQQLLDTSKKGLTDTVDSLNTQSNGGVLNPDLPWAAARLSIEKHGNLPPQLFNYYHGLAGGQKIGGQPIPDNQYADIAAASPTVAKTMAGAIDPLKKAPTPQAVKMQSALAQLPMAPQFNPSNTKDWFTNLESARQQWWKDGPTDDPTALALADAADKARAHRQQTLIPVAKEQIRKIRASGGSSTQIMDYLAQQGISDDEYLRAAEDYAAQNAAGSRP